jgi:hypothetical protein
MYSDPGNVPDGYDTDSDLGRPKDSISNMENKIVILEKIA